MRTLIGAFVFLIPLHAFIVTLLKCKYNIDVDFLRFWKEFVILWLLVTVFIQQLIENNYSLKKIYKGNYIVGTITAFTICSLVYMFFPFFEITMASILWFRYDVVFLLACIVWLYLKNGLQDLGFYIRTWAISAFGILLFFLPWYLFWDISALATSFGYSGEVSSYTANSCISFAQWVEWHYRFQGTFGWPIRFSVFLTVVLCVFSWYILSRKDLPNNKKYGILMGFGLLAVTAIFYSYSKTSVLGLVFATILFVYLARKYIYGKKISKAFLRTLWIALWVPLAYIVFFKGELFLHLWAIINRLDNLGKSIEMFFYNPIGYGLGIAGPASQVGNSIESAGSWQIATSTTSRIYKFLPENWYVQILLEQWIVGLSLFLSILILIGMKLWKKVKTRKDYMSIGMFTWFLALCFMANFTHAFEEAATSYVLFLFLGIYMSDDYLRKK